MRIPVFEKSPVGTTNTCSRPLTLLKTVRHSLRRLIGLGICGGSLLSPSYGLARENVLLETDWRFLQSDPTNAEQVAFNDQAWNTVSLPHCWGWQAIQMDKKYPRTTGWYRRQIICEPKAGRRYFLRFEAAGTVADVYFNGKLTGEHRGGFGAFCFEITDRLAAGGTNFLAVRVSNTVQTDVAPLLGDFPVYGGLYRPVHLIETGDCNFSPTDHGSPGVAWQQTSVSETQALLDVTAQISNGTNQKRPLTFAVKILNATGSVVAEHREEISPATNNTVPYWCRIALQNPHLWNGLKDPYLYHAVVELSSAGEVIDSVEQPLGLRYYKVDPDKGFFLNGRSYPLHGVAKHQDRMDKGWAISNADLDEDIGLIKEIGANVVRCAHYQHSDYFYSLCDQAGILVWAEIPQVERIYPSAQFAETSRSQLLDLIRQNINHPSIFCWSLFNEIVPPSADPHRELQDLNILAHGEDPTRPTIGATCVNVFPQMEKIPDLLGWNRYYGWYYGALSDWGAELDARRYESRDGGFCLSEYGAGANTTQHEDNPAPPKPGGQWHPEEYQNIFHEATWAAIKARPYVWCSFVWNMFDFGSPFRHEGGLKGINDKGLVTFDRKTKKDAFYFYQANWSAEPVVYITDRHFSIRTNEVVQVKVYSNAQAVELSLNDMPQTPNASGTNCVFVWNNVHLQPGKNLIEAKAQISGRNLQDQCEWVLTH